MTPFAVTQRAARLAVELQRAGASVPFDREGTQQWTTETLLRCLYRSGLTLEADLDSPAQTRKALERLGLGIDP